MTEQKKHILIASCGQTPQVITETLYYFYKMAKPPEKIIEVYIITTTLGREKINKALFTEGRFNKFCDDVNIKKGSIKFDDDTIVVPTYDNGIAIDDIKTDKDNEVFEELLWELVKKHTDREDVCVHCSIAGGRKTMSAYAAVVMTLLGRPEDTLSHVLFDKDEDPKLRNSFYYPENKEQEAYLHLANIPYLRLRGNVDIPHIKEKNLVKIIQETQKELDENNMPQKVELLIEDHKIVATPNGVIKFAPKEFFLYHFLADKRKTCTCKDVRCDCYLSIAQIVNEKNISEFRDRYDRYYPENWSLDKEIVRELITRINSKIDAADISPKRIFQIDHKGSRPDTKYGIKLSKDIIEIK